MNHAHRRTGMIYLALGLGLLLVGALGHGWGINDAGVALGLRDAVDASGAVVRYTHYVGEQGRTFGATAWLAYWTAIPTVFFGAVALGAAFGPVPSPRYFSAARICAWLAVIHAVCAALVMIAISRLDASMSAGVAVPVAGIAFTILGCRSLLAAEA